MPEGSIFDPEPEIWKQHESLFHYTSAHGLLGIVSDGRLRATHHRLLNDSSELELVWNLLQSVMFDELKALEGECHPTRSWDSIGEEASELTNTFREVIVGRHGDEGAFIASFCGTPDERYTRDHGHLSLWQGYGPGGGYAIEFHTECVYGAIKRLCSQYGYAGGLTSAVYGKEARSSEWANKLLKAASLRILEWRAAIARDDLDALEMTAGAILEELLPLTVRLKHRSFAEEREVRLSIFRRISSGRRDRPELPIKFYADDAQIIPYVELFEPEELKSAIRRIVIGPHRDTDRRAVSVRLLLREKGINADVAVSDIPFRPR